MAGDDDTMIAARVPAAKNMPPFGALRAFDAVARYGGIRKAALALDRNHAVISRHIRTVEAWTGAVLVERKPAGVVLTDDGRRYHRRIATAIDLIANATVELMKQNDNRSLQICASPGFAFHWLVRNLGEYEKANPTITVEVRPQETIPNLNANEADVDIRMCARYGVEAQRNPGLRDEELIRLPIVPVASPDYLAAHEPIRSAGDLLKHQLLHERNREVWKDWFEVNNVQVEDELPGSLLGQGHLTVDAARHHRGVALSNQFLIAEDLIAGRLVNIEAESSDFENLALGGYVFSARATYWNMPAIRSFRDWLRNEVLKQLADD